MLACRNFSTVHDSYNCQKRSMGPTRAWPSKREGFLYCGSGPTKVWPCLLSCYDNTISKLC